jgi:SulP family sulfate permease
VRGRIREAINGAPAPVRWLVFDAEALTHVDATGIAALKQLINSLRDEGVDLAFARLKDPMRRTLREAGVLETIGEEHAYPTVRAAVEAVREPET